MAYPEKKGRHIISTRDAIIASTEEQRRYLVLDRDTALNVLNQLCFEKDGMPIHGVIIRNDASQFVTRSVRENGEVLPTNDFLDDPIPRNGSRLIDVVEAARLAALDRPDHAEVARKLVVIDRTSGGKAFGLDELTDITVTEFGWVGILKNHERTKVLILSKKYSMQGIKEFTPPRAIS